MNAAPVATALVSVADKRGMVEFCRGLAALGIRILSTGGSARQLREHDIEVAEVAQHTGFPEIMAGRVKTMHPKIHAGILGRRGTDDAVMAAHGIAPIGLVVVNLYPFEAVIARPDCTFEQAIENIDIGGSAMLRAAAKNHRDVTVVVDGGDYGAVLAQLQRQQCRVTAAMRFDLAVKAFAHSAGYDGAIADYLGASAGDFGVDSSIDSNADSDADSNVDASARLGVASRGVPNIDSNADSNADASVEAALPRTLHLHFRKKQDLRYGENPHQRAAFYTEGGGMGAARQLQGKELSYNNIADADAAYACVAQFTDHCACVIVKHANPCGAALAEAQESAYRRAYATDAESAFGGIIAFNQPLESAAAAAIIEQQFAEVIIAPAVASAARRALAAKPNIRLLECALPNAGGAALDYKRVSGGMLAQSPDHALVGALEVVTARAPHAKQMEDLLFAWKIAKFVKSNAIVYAARQATIGIGAGQMSRINAARIAAIKADHAGLEVRGAALASDAFFPFRDAIDSAAEAGIAAIIQPGGALRDGAVIAAADAHDIAMVFTAMRHFRH